MKSQLKIKASEYKTAAENFIDKLKSLFADDKLKTFSRSIVSNFCKFYFHLNLRTLRAFYASSFLDRFDLSDRLLRSLSFSSGFRSFDRDRLDFSLLFDRFGFSRLFDRRLVSRRLDVSRSRYRLSRSRSYLAL